MDYLTAPFRYGFMQNAILAAVLVGVTCAVLGVHVVQRRMAFIGEALAHTTLPGLVIAHLFGWSLSLGGLCAALATALLIGWASRRDAVKEDTAIGVVFTGMFALGVLLMSRTRSYRDLTHMLFGNVLGVTTEDLWFIGGVAAVVLTCLALFHKELELTACDPIYAEVIGLRADLMRFLLLGLVALAVVTGIQTVGVVLTSALLITPAATAALLSDRMPRRMLLGALLATACSVAGLTASYVTETSSGSAIVLCCTAAFMAAYAARSAWHRLRPTAAIPVTKDEPSEVAPA
ncbi:MAG: metal ABC transporter permease [Planctomycetes bacterium]|nr:metal ABC transporter permease [Planctomycetota bacterium]